MFRDEMNIIKHICNWFADVFKVWRREFSLVFSDVGVMLFFFGLSLAYPVVYTVIYNPEVVKDIPVVVVDHSRTAQSRELTRMIDATEAMSVYGYATDLADARGYMNRHECYGILEIPSDYAKRLGRSEQATVTFYEEMDLLLRYRTITAALADIQIALGAKVQRATVDAIGLPAQGMATSPVKNEAVMLGDPTQGFASFIMPGIVVLILQQSIVLGVCMLWGGHRERLRRYGTDHRWVDAPAGAMLLGKMLCYLTLYLPMVYYILYLLPRMFDLPHIGSMWQYLSFIVPLLSASVFFGVCVAQFVKDRESALLVVVFTSVVFLFLSGLTWPRFAMNPFWRMVGSFIPATWGVEGFININSDGATLGDVSGDYVALWCLTLLYFGLGYLFLRLLRRGSHEVQ